MPTGYTAGILDGKINTFHDFALVCVRAFGAAIHMRDESLNTKYEPVKPDQYYVDAVKEARERMIELFSITDEQIIEREKAKIQSTLKYHSERIKEIKALREKLEYLLDQARKYEPPTLEHVEIKQFMIQQLEGTIEHDCDLSYHEEYIEMANSLKDKPIDPKVIRDSLLDDNNRDMQHAEERLKENIDKCNEANEWVKVFLDSIK
jgi:uncharacterized lipoprotein YehR (DUF1307 family)